MVAIKMNLLLFELVGAKDLETLLPLGGGEPLLAAFKLLEDLLNRNVLLKKLKERNDRSS